MKKTFKLATILFLNAMPIFLYAQDNTYPASGNVGIGTLAPGSKLTVIGGINATGTIGSRGFFHNVLQVGPLENAPAYFYFDTNIPAIDGAAPQLYITGYTYGAANKAMKLILGWYHFSGSFYWSQYQSDFGFAEPSRIRIGKYTKDGNQYVRVEVSNDGMYWSNYSISATDPFGSLGRFDGWTWYEGEMPSGTTTSIEVVNRWKNVSVDANLSIGKSSPVTRLDVNDDANGALISLGATARGTENDASLDFYAMNGSARPTYARVGLGVNNGTVGYESGYMTFSTILDGSLTEKMRITNDGKIGVGVKNPSEKLVVNGNIKARKVTVSQSGWPDYVFDSTYALMSIPELASYITFNRHLPEVPSAMDVEKNGVDIGNTQSILLKKMEEMTLYIIQLNKELESLKTKIKILEHGKNYPKH